MRIEDTELTPEAKIAIIFTKLEQYDSQIKELKDQHETLHELVSAVKVMAVNMEYIGKKQEADSDRITSIEERPGENWRSVVSAFIGAVTGYVVSRFGG